MNVYASITFFADPVAGVRLKLQQLLESLYSRERIAQADSCMGPEEPRLVRHTGECDDALLQAVLTFARRGHALLCVVRSTRPHTSTSGTSQFNKHHVT